MGLKVCFKVGHVKTHIDTNKVFLLSIAHVSFVLSSWYPLCTRKAFAELQQSYVSVSIDPLVPNHLACFLLFSNGELFWSSNCFVLIHIPPKPIQTEWNVLLDFIKFWTSSPLIRAVLSNSSHYLGICAIPIDFMKIWNTCLRTLVSRYGNWHVCKCFQVGL